MRLHISEVRDGDVLANDTFNSYGVVVISAGATMTSNILDDLNKHKIDYIDIMESNS
ncbi:hypothetical protein [Paenibacillus crassostreae]|uniref:hypothetical protein n=1 Tax=Paenibacillus crassostreae TaxID=1763538 RepID=UPI000AEA15A9|nr:hypothetical protein [Paenibacillus crassostreae]